MILFREIPAVYNALNPGSFYTLGITWKASVLSGSNWNLLDFVFQTIQLFVLVLPPKT